MWTRLRNYRIARPAACALVLAGTLATVQQAVCDPVEDFYRGKQIRIYIRAAPGGGYDLYSRVLGRYMSKFIPGNPTIVPINMPGGGGLVALNYVANVAPKDGTALTIVTSSLVMDQALGAKNIRVDLRALDWIGNMSNTSTILITKKSSPVRTLDDAKKIQIALAATGAGSFVTQLAAVYNNMLGTKFKLVYGYPSNPAMALALERNEVEARTTTNPYVLVAPGAPKEEALARYNFIIQTGTQKLRDYEEVPLLRDLASAEDQRRVFDFISGAGAIDRPLATGPGVPADRVAALRRAFDATLADPAFQKDAGLQALEISPMTGEEVTRIVQGMIGAPPAVIREVAQAIQIPGAEPAKGAHPGAE